MKRLRPLWTHAQKNGPDFEKFGGNGSTKFITGGQDRHRPLKKLLEQLGLDSHEVGEWVDIMGRFCRRPPRVCVSTF